MIAIVLGGAPGVWKEVEEARRLLSGRRHLVVAANMAGVHYRGQMAAWCSLHPEALPGWRADRARARRPEAGRHFVPAGIHALPWAEQSPDRWNGSSGLYAAQVALFEIGATAVILCGIPMESAAGHFISPGSWAGTADYRWGFERALREVGGRFRSMGGWTEGLFGAPTPEWLAAVENIKPLGSSAPQHARIAEMYNVTNTGKTSARFWAKDEAGQLALHHLDPGETVTADIDPDQPKFQGGNLSIKEVGQAPKQAAPRKKKAAAKPAPKKPVPPAEPAPSGV